MKGGEDGHKDTDEVNIAVVMETESLRLHTFPCNICIQTYNAIMSFMSVI